MTDIVSADPPYRYTATYGVAIYAPPSDLAIAFPDRGAQTYGVTIGSPSTPGGGVGPPHGTLDGILRPDSRMRVYHSFLGDLHSYQELFTWMDLSWQTVLSEEGSGSLAFPRFINDAGDWVENGELFGALAWNGDDVITLELDGFKFFAFILTEADSMVIDVTDHANEKSTLSGPGLLAGLGRAVIYPSLGVGVEPMEEDHNFDWTAIEFDDSGWITASALGTMELVKFFITYITSGVLTPLENFEGAAYAAAVCYPGDTLLHSLDVSPNESDRYCRQPISVLAPGFYSGWFGCDDIGKLYVDGQQMAEVTSSGQVAEFGINFTIGDHLIAWSDHQWFDSPFFGTLNPAYSGWTLFRGGGIYLAPTPDFVSSAGATKIQLVRVGTRPTGGDIPEYPPGMSVGKILSTVLNQAIFRGCFPWLTWDFTDTHDSAGRPWPIVATISTKTGTDVLTFFKEVAQTYTDLVMTVGGTLRAYNIGTRRTSTSFTFEPKTLSTPDGLLIGLEAKVEL